MGDHDGRGLPANGDYCPIHLNYDPIFDPTGQNRPLPDETAERAGGRQRSANRNGSRADPLRGRACRREHDSERAIRWLVALMVLCCDPLAIALTAAASVRRSTV